MAIQNSSHMPLITVVGAGGVGGHLAARLALAGVRLTLIARGEHLTAIQRDGLNLESGEQRYTVKVAVTDDPATLPPQDIVIVSVKIGTLDRALASIQPLLHEQTRVVVVMNGLPWWYGSAVVAEHRALLDSLLDPNGKRARWVPQKRLSWGVAMAGGQRVKPGWIKNTSPSRNRLDLGYPDGHQDAVLDQLMQRFSLGGVQVHVARNLPEKIWEKLLINAGQSMVCTATERTVHATLADPETRQLVRQVMAEIKRVGARLGVTVTAEIEALTRPELAPHHYPSFLQDLKAGRPLELENTVLAVRDIGLALGEPIPMLTTLATIVHARSKDLIP